MRGFGQFAAVAGLIWLLAFAAGCGSARKAEPLAGPMMLEDVRIASGREVFLTHCHQCHPGGEGGLGPSLNDKPLPDFLIRLQVRGGIGVMPGFPSEEISESEMQDFLAYLRALRNH